MCQKMIEDTIEEYGARLYILIILATYGSLISAFLHVFDMDSVMTTSYRLQMFMLMIVSVVNIMFNWKKPVSRYFNVSVVVAYAALLVCTYIR